MCEVICPYCYEQNDTERVYEYEEDCLELECSHCGKIMSVALFPEPYAVRLPFKTCSKCGQDARADELINGICRDCRKEEEKAIKEMDKYLSNIKNIDALINAKMEQAKKVREHAEYSSASKETKVQQQYSDKVKTGSCLLVQIETEINQKIDAYYDLKRKAINIIDSIENNDYKILLTEHYLNGKSIEEVAEILNRESRYTYKLRRKALLEFKKDSKRHVKTVF